MGHDYFCSEEWQHLRRWLPGHPAGRALAVRYRRRTEQITLQLYKHDGTKSNRLAYTPADVWRMHPQYMSDLIWEMSDTTGVDTPEEALAVLRKRLIEDGDPACAFTLRAFKAVFGVEDEAQIRAVAGRIARANGWQSRVFMEEEAVGFRWPRPQREVLR